MIQWSHVSEVEQVAIEMIVNRKLAMAIREFQDEARIVMTEEQRKNLQSLVTSIPGEPRLGMVSGDLQRGIYMTRKLNLAKASRAKSKTTIDYEMKSFLRGGFHYGRFWLEEAGSYARPWTTMVNARRRSQDRRLVAAFNRAMRNNGFRKTANLTELSKSIVKQGDLGEAMEITEDNL